jgi:hypothetical protein
MVVQVGTCNVDKHHEVIHAHLISSSIIALIAQLLTILLCIGRKIMI